MPNGTSNRNINSFSCNFPGTDSGSRRSWLLSPIQFRIGIEIEIVLLWWLHNKYDASTSELIRFNNFCQTHTNTCNYGSLSSSAVNCFWRVPQCQPHFPHFPSPFGAANICHATPCESKMPSGNRKCQMPFYSEARKLWKIAVGANWFSMLFDLWTPRVK